MSGKTARADLPALGAKRPDGVSFDLPRNAVARWNNSITPAAARRPEETAIDILDFIGPEEWGGVSAKTVARALKDAGDVVVNINSPGGDLFEGVAIYNLLREHKGKVTVKVLGLAASAASIVAMAGDSVEIGRAAWMMVHNVWVLAIGNRNDLRRFADELEAFDDALAGLYAARTGRTKRKMSELMDAETWFDGEAAIDGGFADELLAADAVGRRDPDEDDEDEEYASLAHRIDASLLKGGTPRADRMVLMNQLRGALSKRPAIPAQPQLEAIMTQQTTQQPPAAAPAAPAPAAPAAPEIAAAPAPVAPAAVDQRARIKVILALDEAKGREKQANYLALETEMTVDQAKGVLAASPKASRLDDVMAGQRPGVRSAPEDEAQRPKMDSPFKVYERLNQAYRDAAGARK